MRRYFILNVGLVLGTFLSLHAAAQSKGSTPALSERQSTPILLTPPTNSVLDGVVLGHPKVPTDDSTSRIPSSFVSPWLVEVVKMLRARIDDSVLVTFIDSGGTFNLDAEKIIYLRDLGLSGELISVMLQHDAEIASGVRPVPPAPAASPATVHLGSSPSQVRAPTPALTPANAVTEKVVSTHYVLPKTSENGGQSGSVLTIASAPEEEEQFDVPIVHLRSTPPSTFSPVRQPYAVQLVDPIVVYRASGRAPNLMRLEVLP